MNMMTFTGWVEHIFDPDDYRWEFSVTDCDPENPGNVKWPSTLKFTTSKKTGTSALVENIGIGDKITVAYYLVGKSGTSKKSGKYFCFNELAVARNNGIRMIEKKSVTNNAEPPADDDGGEDLPF